MKRRRLTAFLLALILVLAPAFSALGAPATVYLLALNDKFCDLPGGAMPVAINGIIYVPYSTFDRNLTGVNLGVYYGITLDQGTVLTLYSLNNGALTFTLNTSSCVDDQGNTVNMSATMRGGIPYVPAAAVCNFFGLQYSFLPTTDRGTAIRLTDPTTPHMDDGTFLASAKSAMTTRYDQLVQGSEPKPTPAPTAPPSVLPTPPAASQRPPDSNGQIHLYLSLDASQAEAEVLERFPEGVYALLLFTPQSLPQQASLVRKAVAAGHSVGLLLDGSLPLPEALEQLEQGNRLLSHIARIKTRIVACEDFWGAPLAQELRDRHWVLWDPDLRSSLSPASLSSLLGSRPATLRLDLTATGPSALRQVISALRSDGYDLLRPLETGL